MSKEIKEMTIQFTILDLPKFKEMIADKMLEDCPVIGARLTALSIGDLFKEVEELKEKLEDDQDCEDIVQLKLEHELFTTERTPLHEAVEELIKELGLRQKYCSSDLVKILESYTRDLVCGSVGG